MAHNRHLLHFSNGFIPFYPNFGIDKHVNEQYFTRLY